MSDSLKIVELKAANVKRLRAVTITPDGNLVVIGGDNGQGKSSVLDAIQYALAGKGAIPSDPVHRGEEEARIHLDLGDLVVDRKILPDGKGAVVVSGRDGARFNSPQAMLDKLFGPLTFDPLVFLRAKPIEQADILKRALGVRLDDLDAKRKSLYDQRTALNRTLKDAEAQYRALPEDRDAPAAEVSMSALADELNGAIDTVTAVNEARIEHATASRHVNELMQRAVQLEQQMKALKVELDKAMLVASERQADLEDLEATVIDPTPIKAKMEQAESLNRRYRAQSERHAAGERVSRFTAESESLTKAISALDAERVERLRAAQSAVPGLSLSESGSVTLNGLPFEQASQAEQLKVSLAVGIAQNPKLRVVLIRDGSLLDRKSLSAVAETAKASDMQVWIERVGDGDECSVVIEDGEVRP